MRLLNVLALYMEEEALAPTELTVARLKLRMYMGTGILPDDQVAETEEGAYEAEPDPFGAPPPLNDSGLPLGLTEPPMN